MTLPPYDLAELRALLDALCEESSTAGQVQRLAELVLAHPEAEVYYVQYMSLHADLAGYFGGRSDTTEQSLRDCVEAGRGEVEPGQPDPRKGRWPPFTLAQERSDEAQ